MNDWRALKASQGTEKSLRSMKQQVRMQTRLEQAKQLVLKEMVMRLEVQFDCHR